MLAIWHNTALGQAGWTTFGWLKASLRSLPTLTPVRWLRYIPAAMCSDRYVIRQVLSKIWRIVSPAVAEVVFNDYADGLALRCVWDVSSRADWLFVESILVAGCVVVWTFSIQRSCLLLLGRLTAELLILILKGQLMAENQVISILSLRQASAVGDQSQWARITAPFPWHSAARRR